MLTTCINFGEIYFLTNFRIFLRGYIMILLISVFSQENAFSGGFSIVAQPNQGVQLRVSQRSSTGEGTTPPARATDPC